MENKKNKLVIIIGAVAVVAILAGVLVGIALTSFLNTDKATASVEAVEVSETVETVNDEPSEEVASEEEKADTEADIQDEDVPEAEDEDIKKDTDEKVSDGDKGEELLDDGTGMPIEEAKELIKPAEVKPEVEIKAPAASNGKYMIVVDDVSYMDAMKDCKERGGHLLIIDDYDEYAKVVKFIYDNTADNCIFYLGGMRDDKSKEYHWVDAKGDIASSTVLNNVSSYSAGAWAENEPGFTDNHDNEELYMAMYYNSGEGRWVWCDVVNDLPGNANTYMGRTAYICEFE